MFWVRPCVSPAIDRWHIRGVTRLLPAKIGSSFFTTLKSNGLVDRQNILVLINWQTMNFLTKITEIKALIALPDFFSGRIITSLMVA